MLDKLIGAMAKLRQDRSHGQKLSHTPSAARKKHWPGVKAVQPPNSQPIPLANTKIVFDDEEDDQSVLPKVNLSKKGQNNDKSEAVIPKKPDMTVREATSTSENGKNDDSSRDSVYNSASEDADGAKSLKQVVNDMASQKNKNLASSSKNRYTIDNDQNHTTGNEEGAAEQDQRDSVEATPTPSQLTNSSLQKLKDAKASALSQKKRSSQSVSPATNVLHARSPPPASNQTVAVSSSMPSVIAQQKPALPALLSSPSTALMQTAQTLGSWKPSQDILVHSSSPQSIKKAKKKKRHSEPSHATTIRPPKTYGSPPSPPSLRLNSIQKARKARKDAEKRISDVWGKTFASQKLVIEPFQTFSSNFSSFDVESSSEGEYLDKMKKGNSAGSDKKGVKKLDGFGRKESKTKKHKSGKQGWDAVLAEAKAQAERLEQRRIEMEKLRSPVNESLNQKQADDDDHARKEKKRKIEKADRIPTVPDTKNENTASKIGKEEPSKESKKRKRLEEVIDEGLRDQHKSDKRDKRRCKNKEKRLRNSADKHTADVPDTTPEQRLLSDSNNNTSNNSDLPNEPPTSTLDLADLRDLIPKLVLKTTVKALNNAEHSHIEERLALKQRKEFKRIKKGKISSDDAFWKYLDVETARKTGFVEKLGIKTFSENDDAVVIKAAGGLIRTLSQNAVASAASRPITPAL